MNTKYILSFFALSAILAGCTKENNFISNSEKAADNGKLYTFSASAQDPATTKSFFKADEAPSYYIYWEDTDEFDFHDITLNTEDWSESVTVTSSKPSAIGASKKSVTFEKKAHDFMIISYPKGAVTLLDTTSVYSYDTNTKKSDTTTFFHNAAVKVNVPKVQELSSVLTPANLPMVSPRLALSQEACNRVKNGADTISTEFSNPVKLTPLAGLVKMTVTGLPDVTSATVTKVNIMSEFNSSSTYTGTPQRGLRGDNIISLADTMAVVGNWTSGDNRFDLSLTGGSVDYTSTDGATVCFVANHSIAQMKTILVTVYTSDGAVYQKKFNTSSKAIAFSKSRVTSFTLDFTSSSVVKAASEKFSVEWSQGYLVFDDANKTYKIGDKQDIGLYFKFGSANAIAFYDSNQDWLDRIRPTNLISKDIEGTSGSQEVTPDGQTLKNGTDYFYSNQTGLAASWRNHPFYTATDGVVTMSTMTSEEDYFNWQGSSVAKDETDPCSYVKVAEGENSWRMPTLDEINDLIKVGAPGVEFGNFDGSDIKSNDGKSRFVKYTDGEQTFYLMANGISIMKIMTKYKSIQAMFGNKYAANFLSSTYHGNATVSTSTSTNYCDIYQLSLSSAPGVSTAAKVAKGVANTYNSTGYKVDTRPWWDAINVSCVRDKKSN